MRLALLLLLIFAKYPAAPALRGAPAKVRLDSAKVRRFRTVLREEAQQGVNFNGHYRLAKWGCGTNCIEWAVIDLADGRVWMAPRPMLSCAGSSEGGPDDWFEFRVDSRLLAAHDCTGNGLRVFDRRTLYEWTPRGPRKLGVSRLP